MVINDRKISAAAGKADYVEYCLPEGYETVGLGRTFFVRTYGCQANVRDGETLAGMLASMGYTAAADQASADILIFNTCAVRRAAEEHVLGEVGNLKHEKEADPDKIYILCGCMAQEPGIVEDIKKKYPQVDLVFGTHNIDAFPGMLVEFLRERKRIIRVDSIPGNVVEGMPVTRNRKYKAFVNIMYGCNKFCTYCIVPYTRGRERSRKKEAILEEVRAFRMTGGKEVTLLGQNVNAYGKDLGMKDGFTELLVACAETGIERIRFYTSHPRDYSSTTIDAMRSYPNIMRSLHLPVQSGSNEVLRRMNRGYTVEQYFKLFDDMKERIPEITFTTDLIVGFPGETDAQFEETLKLVDYCRFDSAFTFVYSPREGTPAARMEDRIPMEVKKQRLAVLNERIGKYANENNRGYLNRELLVLCDGTSKKNENVYAGYSEENKLVNFTGVNIHEGDIVRVRITDTKSYSLDGEAIAVL